MTKLNYLIRKAQPQDMAQVHDLVRELAAFEKAPEQVATSPEEFIRDGFGDNPAFDCLVAELDEGEQAGKIIGFALFYTNYSTWKGKCLYLEDLLINEPYRRQGVGEALFLAVKEEAVRRKVRRMDWQVLDWNEPAIAFYKGFGATLDGEWLNGRLFEADLK